MRQITHPRISSEILHPIEQNTFSLKLSEKETDSLETYIEELHENLAQAEVKNLFLEEKVEGLRLKLAESQYAARYIAGAMRMAKKYFSPSFFSMSGSQKSLEEDFCVLNAMCDIRYMHSHPAFQRVLHLSHQEWFGIRAAAGSLPGIKLSISANVPLKTRQLHHIAQIIAQQNPTRIVAHGLSYNMLALLEYLSRTEFREYLFLVIHGSPAMWHAEPERQFVYAALNLSRNKQIRRLHIMRSGFDFPSAHLFRPILFNLSPNLSEDHLQKTEEEKDKNIVFVPGWKLWHKNIYATISAAALSSEVEEIWAYAKDIELMPPFKEKLRILPYHGREQTFRLFSSSTLTANISHIDCHPMVNIEFQALGQPCLRGRLFLDALEDHPYIQVTMVEDASSFMEIRRKIETLLEMEPHERRELTLDYQKKSDEIAINRYHDFLEL